MNNVIGESVLHITTCCSHHCDFCYAIDDQKPHIHQDYSILLKIIEELSKTGCKSILFVGGDPASHPRSVDLARAAKSFGMETGILSNTLFFENYSAVDVMSAFDNIEATVHSGTPQLHDNFCKKDGAYNFVIKNLKALKSPNTHLGVVYNITPNTYDSIESTIKKIIEIDNAPIDHVVFQRIVSVGRAHGKSNWELSAEFLESTFSQIERIQKTFNINISFEDTFPLCVVPNQYKHYIHPCSWGWTSISVDMYGNVAKCCTDPNYTLGNILEVPLVELWRKSTALIERRSGKHIPPSCHDCMQFAHCCGGCILSSEMNGGNGDSLLLDITKKRVK